MTKVLETPRMILRHLEESDLGDLKEILQDPVAMTAYAHAFSDEECVDWLRRMMTRQQTDGISLWAAIDKASGAFLGHCGLTMQQVRESRRPEVGYLFKRRFWHHGYATEAAAACLDYGLQTLGMENICCIIRDNNFRSQAVARRCGMQVEDMFVKQYMGHVMPHFLFVRHKA